MSLLSVVRDVCAVVGVAMPQSVFSSLPTNRTMQEMLALANEMAQRIAYDTRDWTKLKQTQVFAGDGIQTVFPMPADFHRMLLSSNVWYSQWTQAPLSFISDTDEWIVRRARGANSSFGEWTMLGDGMHIHGPPAAGASVYFAYLGKNCINLASGGRSDSFVADGDTFVLSERLLKLGMIWQWKAQKGAPYAEDMGTYGDALTYAMGHDQPAPVIIDRKVAGSGAMPNAYIF